MNLNNIVRFAFTHPENDSKSIREIARLLDINPGTVYRTLLRLRLVKRPSGSKNKKKFPQSNGNGNAPRTSYFCPSPTFISSRIIISSFV